jgi:hypothetical protein
MMSESKITATKVARLGVLVLAFLAALVAVQAFGAKPAEASLGPGGFFHLPELADDAVGGAEAPALLGADDKAKLIDAARPEADEEVARLTVYDPNWQEADTEVAKRTKALKSKIDDSREYVKEGGCLIVDVAAEMGGVPPSDEHVQHAVKTALPKKFKVESEEGSSGSDLVKRKKFQSELVEINHLVRRDMKVPYSSNGEPTVALDAALEILYGVKDTVCAMK